jgi:hypothetical protein
VKNSSLLIELRAVGLPALRIEQHQIDIGGEIQFAAAELAHRHDDELLRHLRRRARLPVARRQGAQCELMRQAQRQVRGARQIRQGFGKARPAGQVAPGDAGEFGAPPAAQRRHELRLQLRARRWRPAAVAAAAVPSAARLEQKSLASNPAARRPPAACTA